MIPRHRPRRPVRAVVWFLATYVGATTTAVALRPEPSTALATAGAALLALGPLAGALRRLEHRHQGIEHAALHDPLTELPNRIAFHDLVHQAITAAARHGDSVAVLLVDLDRFKEVNDTLGHHRGDLLLHLVGTRLRQRVRPTDTVARLGGDEFALLLPAVAGIGGARLVAEDVRAAISDRFVVDDIRLDVEASVGIALFPDHGDDPDTLVQRADVAMYEAKGNHTGLAVYAPERDPHSVARLELLADLRGALDRGEVIAHYQPKADLRTGRTVGVEALVRWAHPRRGLLGPPDFLDAAESTALIRPLTLHVLRLALWQCRAWQRQGFDLGVAVNLSTRNLIDPDLPDRVVELLAETGMDPGRLELEITESMIMVDPPRARAVLDRLSRIGVGLAIDDFGTGYSSLVRLAELPVTTLKIDKSFVQRMAQRHQDATIVRSTVHLGRDLGLRVVAEGVEDEAAWDELARLGCDEAQGYWLSRPAPADQLTAWLVARSEHVPARRQPSAAAQVVPLLAARTDPAQASERSAASSSSTSTLSVESAL